MLIRWVYLDKPEVLCPLVCRWVLQPYGVENPSHFCQPLFTLKISSFQMSPVERKELKDNFHGGSCP